MINGKNIKIYLSGVAIARSKSSAITLSSANVETVSASWRNRTYTDGKTEWKMNCTGLVIEDSNAIALIRNMKSSLQLSFDLPDGSRCMGEGYCTNLQMQADGGKFSTYSLTFQGSGGIRNNTHSGFDYIFDFIFD